MPRSPLLVGGLLLLLVRGVLLWLVIPAAACVWLLGAVWLRPRGIGLGRFLGWVDLNLIACLQRSLLRPLFVDRAQWVAWGDASGVSHRVRLLDPA